MLATQRHRYILERLGRHGFVRVADLTQAFGVTDMTVRRDLRFLERQGRLVKVHGGAMGIIGSALHDSSAVDGQPTPEQGARRAIGRMAADLVEPGMAIAVSAGRTVYEVIRWLVDLPRLTVVTNSVPAAEVLHRDGRGDQTVVVCGGVRTRTDALVGPVAVSALRAVRVDLVIIGVQGMHEQAGFTTPSVLEAETSRALIESGRRLAVLADHTKWGVAGASTFAELQQADIVVTDSGITPNARSVLSRRAGQLLVAGPTGDSSLHMAGGSAGIGA